jgi:hypothetical protein
MTASLRRIAATRAGIEHVIARQRAGWVNIRS